MPGLFTVKYCGGGGGRHDEGGSWLGLLLGDASATLLSGRQTVSLSQLNGRPCESMRAPTTGHNSLLPATVEKLEPPLFGEDIRGRGGMAELRATKPLAFEQTEIDTD